MLGALILAALAALAALRALAKRSGRSWVVVGFALVPCALVAARRDPDAAHRDGKRDQGLA